jgi:hypothetical protein
METAKPALDPLLGGYYAKKEGVKRMICIKPPAELARLVRFGLVRFG